MHAQQFVNRSWSFSQSTDCKTVPMRKGLCFALVSDDCSRGQPAGNGIERQKPWLCLTLWQAYYVTLKKLLFTCFPSILYLPVLESCALFGTPSSSSMLCVSCLFSALGTLPALSKQLFSTTQSSWIPCQRKEERGRWLLIFLINEFNTAHAWNSICTPICISQKGMSTYNIHVVNHKINSIT